MTGGVAEPSRSVAIIGGGQLARMLAEPANALGVPLRLLAASEDDSAAQVIPDTVVGDHRDLAALLSAVSGCDVVTFDHEHVPTEHLRALEAKGVACRPGPGALVHAQDKRVMREAMVHLGSPQPRWAVVTGRDEVAAFGLPCVLKVAKGGYDGRGVWVVADLDDAAEALEAVARSGVELVAEELVAFRRELAALVARSPSGESVAYPIVATTQRDGICHEVIAPAPDLPPDRAAEAQALALRIAGELDVTGILAVELFETEDGGVLVNELAMRPHNTGHWTQDGAVTSQFENHLRAVLDLPLGAPEARSRWTVMVNVLGEPSATEGLREGLHGGLPSVLAPDPHVRVHLYGKAVRPGRKLGHVNVTGDDLEDCLGRARRAAAAFQPGAERQPARDQIAPGARM
ncbi:MAG TPA: 5-(carboxyamino)imidazole ribonucleotide synthase [Ornithinibacter sp.]|nr:5-(carboxyamino)imidazole ribonucleotide synthase [Ornithinibacter sp.]